MSHKTSNNDDIISTIKEFCAKRPTYGYRRITALVRQSLLGQNLNPVNHKRIYRLMKQEELLLKAFPRRPSLTHDGKIITLKSNLRWCSDAFGLRCWNGDLVQVAFSLDCHDREVMSWVASSKGINSELICDLVTESVEYRFGKVTKLPHTIQWLTDNGPCYGARSTVNYCRSLGFEVCTTAPYSPESNGMAEAFVKTFKRDYAYVNDLHDAKSVMEKLGSWFDDYNEKAPHKGLRMMAPREYLRQSTAD